jgi:hypothetical protein
MARPNRNKNGAARSTGNRSAGGSYDAFKEYKGKRYTGMKVGRGHKWDYAAGEWVEKKLTPDEWEFRYAVPKRRRGRAPEGSGVPVGTEYHWYILADQTVKKLDANNYTTEMWGLKYKLAHKRADKAEWSTGERGQKQRLIRFLEQLIADLQRELSEAAPGVVKAKQKPVAAKKKPAAAKKKPAAAKRHLAAA